MIIKIQDAVTVHSKCNPHKFVSFKSAWLLPDVSKTKWFRRMFRIPDPANWFLLEPLSIYWGVFWGEGRLTWFTTMFFSKYLKTSFCYSHTQRSSFSFALSFLLFLCQAPPGQIQQQAAAAGAPPLLHSARDSRYRYPYRLSNFLFRLLSHELDTCTALEIVSKCQLTRTSF